MKTETEHLITAMRVLKIYLQNDSAIFSFINVSKPLLRKMALESHFKSGRDEER